MINLGKIKQCLELERKIDIDLSGTVSSIDVGWHDTVGENWHLIFERVAAKILAHVVARARVPQPLTEQNTNRTS